MKHEHPLKPNNAPAAEFYGATNIFPLDQSRKRERVSVFNPVQAKNGALYPADLGQGRSGQQDTGVEVENPQSGGQDSPLAAGSLKSFPSAQIEGKEWILDVIADLLEFSQVCGLSTTKEALQTTYFEAAKEIGTRPRLELA